MNRPPFLLLLLLISYISLFNGVLAAEDRRGLSEDELKNRVITGARVKQIHTESVIDSLRISRNGAWILFSEYRSGDIKNNDVIMISTDGEKTSILETPYGFKHTPIFWGGYTSENGTYKPLTIFLTYVNYGREAKADGIYTRNMETENSEWILWEEGNFRDLSLDVDERYLLASTGKWDTAVVRSRVHIWPLGTDGGKAGTGYQIAPELKGQVHKIVMTPDTTSILFACTVEDPGSYYGVTNIYRADNRKHAPASLLFHDAAQPTLYPGLYGYILYYKSGNTRVLRYNSNTRDSTEVVTLHDLYANGLEVDTYTGTLYLGVQKSYNIAGLLAISFN